MQYLHVYNNFCYLLQTIVHHAALGKSKNVKNTIINDHRIKCVMTDNLKYECVKMLEILAHLCEQGGDPTCASTEGKTAKEIARNRDYKIVAALLGMYHSYVY